jgi:hypothetical protein
MANWTVENRDGVAVLTYTRPPRNSAEMDARIRQLAGE